MSTPVLIDRDQTVATSGGDGVDGSLVCTAVEQVTRDVKSFVLEAPVPGLTFDAGQYLTVTIDLDGQRLSRCYSISSAPTRPACVTITVKRVPGGPVSDWLHDNLRPGSLLEVSGPFGTFTSARHSAACQLYLTAGSGITPLMSMARTLVDRQSPADVVFVHHARTPGDIIFRDELECLGAEHPGIRVLVVCEDDDSGEVWSGPRGRINSAQLRDVVPDAAEREILICGPPGYRETARDLVLTAGADPGRVHEESYVFGETSIIVPPAATSTGIVTTTHLVEFRRSRRVVECSADTLLLDAATQAGLSLPSMCREGMCGTCKTPLLTGTVDMNHAGGIRAREVDQGKILLCCSTPTSDVVIDA